MEVMVESLKDIHQMDNTTRCVEDSVCEYSMTITAGPGSGPMREINMEIMVETLKCIHQIDNTTRCVQDYVCEYPIFHAEVLSRHLISAARHSISPNNPYQRMRLLLNFPLVWGVWG